MTNKYSAFLISLGLLVQNLMNIFGKMQVHENMNAPAEKT